MKQTFAEYANYYDLFYADKPYKAEAAFVEGLIREQSPQAHTILDLGCGTGRHAAALSNSGYEVVGVDQSPAMLAQARKRAFLAFVVGDIRSVSLGRTFDVVVSLFQVFSYLKTNDDVLMSLRTAYDHLDAGGLFIFDFWYGPSVLLRGPRTTLKTCKREELLVFRVASPSMRVKENLVDMTNEVIVANSRGACRITEVHTMRYYFLPELALITSLAGFKVLRILKSMSLSEPDTDSWYAMMVLQK